MHTTGSMKSAELRPAYMSSGTMVTAIVTYCAACSGLGSGLGC